MNMKKEEWLEEFKRRCKILQTNHPYWSQVKVKMIVSREMPKMIDDGYE